MLNNMKSRARLPIKQSVSIPMLAASMLIAYVLLLRMFDIRAELAESNLQANLIRISRYEFEKPSECVLAGSSIAGRLLPSYFKENGMDVQNLGLDGSCPLFAFEILSLRSTFPNKLLVDTSNLFRPINSNSIAIRESIKSPGWIMSSWFLPFRPMYRPSSILYTWFKKQKDTHGMGIEKAAFRMPHDAPTLPGPNQAHDSNSDQDDQYATVRNALLGFRAKGIEIRLLNIPRGEGWGMPSDGQDRKLADELQIPLIEVGPELARQRVKLSFSDGLHLDVPSARKITAEYAKMLK